MKYLFSIVLLSTGIILSGCVSEGVAIETVSYDSGYSNDYVYSVGYYNNRPYWGNNYYSNPSFIGPYGYWGGDTDTY